MAADRNGFDPFPGSLRFPGLSNFAGPTSAWQPPESMPIPFRNPFTAEQRESFYEGEGKV